LRVLKFGGTSVADADAFRRVFDIISSYDNSVFIISSACAGMTNKLQEVVDLIESKDFQKTFEKIQEIKFFHQNLTKELGMSEFLDELNVYFDSFLQKIDAILALEEVTKKSSDFILSFGERLSVFLLRKFIGKKEKIDYFPAESLIFTEIVEGEQLVLHEKTQNALKNIQKNKILITEGFIASDENGILTTLGRGGSDFSAAIISEHINADCLEIWTDVNGVMTTHPKFCSSSKSVKELSYNEAAELAYFGAKVLHPKTMAPLVQKNIPILVKNSYEKENFGTLVSAKRLFGIKSIAVRENISIITIKSNKMLGAHGFLKRVFEVFEKLQIVVDLISTSEVSISLTIDDHSKLTKLKRELEKISIVEIKKNHAIIAVVGEGLSDMADISAHIFSALKDIHIQMVSFGASEINLSLVVAEKDVAHATKLLHHEIFGVKE
jgi:aspartate kinase